MSVAMIVFLAVVGEVLLAVAVGKLLASGGRRPATVIPSHRPQRAAFDPQLGVSARVTA